MPPGRGGRGGRGGLSRGRPPPSVRNAMAELGKGSLQTYEMLAQAAARSNVDAARGYFPELDSGKKAVPKPLLQSETHIVNLWQEVQQHIHVSPHYVESRNNSATKSGANGKGGINNWTSDLWKLKQYYFKGSTTGSQNSQNSSEKEVSGSGGGETKNIDDLWNSSKSWYISELLPAELIPKKNRYVKKECGKLINGNAPRKRKKQKTSSETSAQFNEINGNEPEEDENNADNEETNNAADANNDEEDDLELDADYQMGAKFDDDEGYEENDSGAEEATF